ncbi:DEAD-box ATP-dependent RNA helicase 13 [Magnolia sinica]|uniref:DEAD-box ATP-dependent RNA helicase 13 n=1 Tax=Magnolia sinica TaxID=86752 RepID=UPI00265B0B5C|nr:DEAD-box ATP-dependent RNA helicase 13 [Magnolia sinica]XP_058101429.1 DEAD-box ATP-dependent RNA helicase 13 [Magnolia sinica]XP_058101430.1 DEAD-box ATP-dependent RNA helicase 13 [Magnolia sinica]
MAAEASPPLPSSKTKKSNKKNLRAKPDYENVGALPWNDSLTNDDPFSLLVGTNEGGFLSLEEIDESEYGLLPGFAKSGEEALSNFSKSKKRKLRDSGGGSDDDLCVIKDSNEETTEERKGRKKKKKKKKKTEKKKNGETVKEKIDEGGPTDRPCVSTDGQEDNADGVSSEKVIPDEDEFYAWKELRLHPLLMKSIYRLGFKEPTPIQKACIPAAAHQGKDVIGAAETGSGKTLAFGLPILQRLLEEREKAARLLGNEGDAVSKGVQGSPLRALIVTPTRELALQVSDHLKEAAKLTNITVVPIVGGMSTEKQERLLKRRPEIIVGTPGRLWELMSGGGQHLAELHALSFFVLDEADRMIESGHFHELQSIIDRLPNTPVSVEGHPQTTQACETVLNVQHKKRQTFVFSATVALSAGFRKKLKRGSLTPKASMNDSISSIETLSERAGMRADAAIVDLTNASIMADKLEESFIECKEEDKEAYLYYLLSVHGHGQTIVFCTSIAALRRISSLLRVLGINVWTLHAQMQQRARLKAIDRFRGSEHGVLVATDVAARGLDIPGVRTVVHYQLPHSAEVYVHRSGRTARASSDGCCIAIISPSDRSKFASLCKSFSKESLKRFPIDNSYMSEVLKRLSLARQIENISRNNSQEKAKKNWFKRNAESVELVVEDSGSEEERVKSSKQKKMSCLHLKKLQEELNILLTRPLQPKTFSHRYLAGAGISTLLQGQLEELGRQKLVDSNNISSESKKSNLLVIGRDCIEPLQALRSAGNEVCMDLKHEAERQKTIENRRRKRRDEKKRMREQRRREKKHKKDGGK